MYKWIIAFLVVGVAYRWRQLIGNNISTNDKLDAYDYIIVGAGSAGGVLAARLSENPNHTVALIEAGPDNEAFPDTNIPALIGSLRQTDVDWNYRTVPQNNSCWALVDKRSLVPSGKALGGSSLINSLMVQRGSPHNYNLWQELGNTGWGYQHVLPYFKKLESVTTDNLKASDTRGREGPITVEEPNPLPVFTKGVLEAAKQAGMDLVDTNDGDKLGWMQTQFNTKKGQRMSTAHAYIKPAMSRPNLYVYTKAHVTKVLFDGDRAVGVEYMEGGRMKSIRVNKEVILSAGAIGSPQILMLSGIGPRQHLEDLGIPVKVDLPVGENLKDHISTDALACTLEKPVTMVSDRIGLLDVLEYYIFGTGLMSWTATGISAFMKSKYQPEDEHFPHLQIVVVPALAGQSPADMELIRRFYDTEPEIFQSLHGGVAGRDGLTLFPVLLQPESTGNIRLKSTNPFDYPLINPNYLSEEMDVKKMIDGIRIAQHVAEQPALKALGAQRLGRVHPLCTDTEYDSDEYWACYVRSNTHTVYHPVGTCKMAPDGDPTSVVDPELRVRGVSGLRVVDASIMPTIPSANTNIPTIMVAEKAADIIKSQV